MNTAPAFIHPAFARTAPSPEPMRWRTTGDVRAMAIYIRAVLAARRLGVRS